MNINEHGYLLSDVRDVTNEKLKEKETGENVIFPASFYYNYFISIPFLSNYIITLPLWHWENIKTSITTTKKELKRLNSEDIFFFSFRIFGEELRCFDIMKIIFFVQVLVLTYQRRSWHYSIVFCDLYYFKYDFTE